MDIKEESSALVKKRRLDVVPQAPPPKRIKRPATVIDEETYLDGLSHIIARDYYPGLLENEAKSELLDAIESKDDVWISSAQSKLQNILTSSSSSHLRATSLQQTPRNFAGDTPIAPSIDSKPKTSVNLNLSLGAFQAKYTSEDNESFNALLDKQNNINRQKHAYHWNGNMIPSNRLIAYREQQAEIKEASSKELVLADNDNRPALLKHNTTAPQNSLMFPPDSVEDSLTTVAQAAEAKSNAPPKSISAKNTRFEDIQAQDRRVAPSPSLSAINEAVAGKPRYSQSEAPFETPRVAGYTFVDAEPTEEEIRAISQPVDSSEILSRLTKGASEAAGSPFNIKEAGKREQLHHKLVDKSKAKGRIAELSGNSAFGKTPTPRFKSAPAKGSLTPAGEALLGKVKGSNEPRTPKTGITNFDLTPISKRGSKKDLLPGLTPKR